MFGIPKRGPYRNRALLDLAHRLQECQLKLPGVCVGFSEHGCEPAHSNFHEDGKGGARKADDDRHAAACHNCHAELDQGRSLTLDEKKEAWNRAHKDTISEYFRRGWLVVR